MYKKILTVLMAAFLCANTAVAVDVDNFSDLNNAVAGTDSPMIINIISGDDLTSTANINAQGGAVLTINGNGYTLNGNNNYGGFNISNGQTLTLENINLNSFKSNYSGAAIYNNTGSVIIGDNVSFTSNSINASGGTIYNVSGTLTIGDNVSFTSNFNYSYGGAIYNNVAGNSTSSVTIGDNASFTSNSSYAPGGAISNNVVGDNITSSLTIGDNASFTLNSSSAWGAAIS
ncbi:MAG: hypothetical protein LBJ74_01060, partial [Heliobacteriaceae bacterium]|nr:hypothetical protein [Heliobacteriaceae bacterium]